MAKPSRRRRRKERDRNLHAESNPGKPPPPGPRSADAILVNQLTVGSAVHLVKTEGGALSTGRIGFRALVVLLVAGFTARAIVLGHATVWHLFLPMVAEYLVLLLALPVVNLLLHDPGLRRDARRALLWLLVLAVIASLWIGSRAFDEGTAWTGQAKVEMLGLRDWIVGHEMHWPILAAGVAMAAGIPARVAAFHRHGPPFLAVGMGCAMRLVVAICGGFLLPLVVQSTGRITWAIWTLLLVSELGALWMHWDLQRRLGKRGIEV